MNFQNGGQGGPLGMSRDTNRVGFSNLGGNNNSNRGNSNSRNTGNRRNTNRNRQNFGNNFDNGNRGFNRNGQQGRNTRVRNVRPRQRVNFAFPERSTTFVVDALRTQFAAHAENRPALAGVSVQESNGRVVLTGYVDSEENRRLAAMIAKLEPGVTVVENRLTIQ